MCIDVARHIYYIHDLTTTTQIQYISRIMLYTVGKAIKIVINHQFYNVYGCHKPSKYVCCMDRSILVYLFVVPHKYIHDLMTTIY